jgi:hypothetical protein
MGVLDRFRGTTRSDPPAKAVIAAAMPLNGPGVRAVNRGRQQTTQEQWQQEGWYYFDAMGELRGPLVWIANAVSQADVHATDIDPDTGKPTGPTDNAMAIAAAAMVLGGPSQRSGLLRTLALCWQVPGESWVIIRPPAKRGGPDQWLVLSGNKVRPKGESWTYTDPVTSLLVTLSPGDRLLRVWQPHPNDQARADSAVRPALPICREVEKATQSIAARLNSRLASNGVWLVPEEIDYPKGDHETVGQAIMDLFLSVAEMGIQNPGQAEAAVPIVLTVPGELISQAVWQDFASTLDASVVELRQDGLRRLAATLDMPKDVAEGTQGESNHWSAWQVEESTYKIFIEPLLKALGDALTEHWFRPALIAMGMSPEEAERFELGWDTTAIVARPDDSEVLRDLYDKRLISEEYYLTENGVPEDARPDEEEYQRRFLEQLTLASPPLITEPGMAEALNLTELAAAQSEATEQAAAEAAEIAATQAEAREQRALPAPQGEEMEPEAVPDGLVAAAELIVYDALSRAGGRLLTNQNRGQFKSTPRHELHVEIACGAPGQWQSLLEGSFQFTDPVAEAFGYWPRTLREELRDYCARLLLENRAHDREELRRTLATLPKEYQR